jgi:hypothetical protein
MEKEGPCAIMVDMVATMAKVGLTLMRTTLEVQQAVLKTVHEATAKALSTLESSSDKQASG